MKHILIITSFLLSLATSLMVSNVTFAQEKPTAALAPMGALGELDEIEKKNYLQQFAEFNTLPRTWIMSKTLQNFGRYILSGGHV